MKKYRKALKGVNMKRISQKEINYTIEQYNYICSTIRAEQKENERITTLYENNVNCDDIKVKVEEVF
mgnify:CR=1 FL=1